MKVSSGCYEMYRMAGRAQKSTFHSSVERRRYERNFIQEALQENVKQ